MIYFDDFSVMSQIRYVVPFRHAGVFFFSSVQFTKFAGKWEFYSDNKFKKAFSDTSILSKMFYNNPCQKV